MLRAKTACNFSSLIWPAGSAPAASLEKHSVSRLSYPFAHLHLLSSYSFSSTLLSSNLSLLSASSLLCFSSVHIVGSLTSKLPSVKRLEMYIYIYMESKAGIESGYGEGVGMIDFDFDMDPAEDPRHGSCTSALLPDDDSLIFSLYTLVWRGGGKDRLRLRHGSCSRGSETWILHKCFAFRLH